MPKNNTFYVQSNVIVNTVTGEVTPILTLTQIKEVATGWAESEASKYLAFIEARRRYFNPEMAFDIVSADEPGEVPTGDKLIRGVIRDGK